MKRLMIVGFLILAFRIGHGAEISFGQNKSSIEFSTGTTFRPLISIYTSTKKDTLAVFAAGVLQKGVGELAIS